MSADALINRYRPTSFDEVVGHKTIVSSLKSVIKNRSAHSFLFVSTIPGIGKTTFSRLTANALAADGLAEIIDVPAALYTGVEDMRNITEGLRFRPLHGNIKVLVLDECHRMSGNAVDAILKLVEEPPEWVYWVLCTTNAARLPKTMVSRCATYKLEPLSANELFDFLCRVADEEDMIAPDEVIQVCAKAAGGSPREALSNLAKCADIKDRAVAAELLRTTETTKEAVELARALVSGKSWAIVHKILKGLEKVEPEGIRYMVLAYATKAILGTASADKAAALFPILEAFSQPFNTSEGMAPLVLACGKIIFGE